MAPTPSTESVDYVVVPPDPGALIESLRAFGYTPEASVADLIDNSIFAGARNIWLEFSWDGSRTTVAVIDDGAGMDAGELQNAMKAGSANPLQERSKDDLGRFGLGLKTASFAQARSLTVRSRPADGDPTVARWDLDYVNQSQEWRLLGSSTGEADELLARIDPLTSGTAVLWERLDRIVDPTSDASDADAQEAFLARIQRVEQHVAMVFHRYLTGRRKITIRINGREIQPWDPFLQFSEATQTLTTESLKIFGDRISVEPYVLAHHSHLTDDEHAAAAGPEGWNAQQGFYIYRNRRLLVAGSWLNFFRQEEHYKLARILVDIPNSMDAEWDIDVKKSQARPPDSLREDLRRIARVTRDRASEVYRHRGRATARKAAARHVNVWEYRLRKGRHTYRINREHPAIVASLESAEGEAAVLLAALRVIEETVPVQQIWLTEAKSPDGHATPFEGDLREVSEVLERIYLSLRRSGKTHEQVMQQVATTEPFAQFPELVQVLREQMEEK